MRLPTPIVRFRSATRGSAVQRAGIAPAPLLPLALALVLMPWGTPAFAQEEEDDADVQEAVEEVIEERAAEEDADGEAAGADVGEASYNVEDCRPANDAEVVAEVEDKDLDACEDMDK